MLEFLKEVLLRDYAYIDYLIGANCFTHFAHVFTYATQYKLWINKLKYVCSAVPVEADGEGGQYFRKNEVLWTLFVYNITSTYVLLAKEFFYNLLFCF